MLVLSRRILQSVVIGAPNPLERLLKVTVLEICGDQVKLGIEVNNDLPVYRWEVWQRICADASPPAAPQDPAAPFA